MSNATQNAHLQNITESINVIAKELSKVNLSLAAASADLNATRAELATAQANQVAPLKDRALACLSGEYKLRSVEALVDALGESETAIIRALDDAGIALVFKRRREDGAKLIGLASRVR